MGEIEAKDIISVISLLGLGGVLGAWIKHLLERKKETEIKIQNLNENKYRSILVFMRCVLNPNSIKQFDIHDPNFQNIKEEAEIVLAPIKQENYSRFQKLIKRFVFSLKSGVCPGSIFPSV